MNCKFCNSPRVIKYGSKAGIQYYKCKDCQRKFAGRLAPEGMRFATATIGEALGLFFAGLSLSDISRHLVATEGTYVDPATVWRWVIRYSKDAEPILNNFKIKATGGWVLKETMIKVGGRNLWLWDVIDIKSRFLLATRLTPTRTMKSAIAILSEAHSRTTGIPKQIVSDGVKACPDVTEQVFGADSKHILIIAPMADTNTNLNERFQLTVKERTKIARELKTVESARIILKGFLVHYNFLRPHMTLGGKTPAIVAGLSMPFKTWIELVDYLGVKEPKP